MLLLGWGAAFAWIYGRLSRVTGAFAVITALVVSHWVLDFVTHRPDLPLYPGSAKFGLGLWRSIPATVAIELALFAAGVWVYAATTRARDRVGRWAFWSLMVFLVVDYVFEAPRLTATLVCLSASFTTTSATADRGRMRQ